jgi:hypothetical protein
VRIDIATQAAPVPGRPNEDAAASGPGWAFVLDGATPTPGVGTGCRHDVPWLVGRLTTALRARLSEGAHTSLADLLADAVAELRDAHNDTCDLGNPDSPSSTVAIARVRGATLDYLVLCDSPIALRHADGRITVIDDDRLARLPGGRPYRASLVREHRNRPGGFWVASTDPAAAYQALTGAAGLTDAALTDAVLCTDGVARLAEWYGYPWPRLLGLLRDQGPRALIDLVRAAERGYPHPYVKQHDDATVAHLRW